MDIGAPYYAPPDFDLEARLQEVRDAQAAADVGGVAEAGDNDGDGLDPDEPSLLPENTPVPEPAENLDALYEAALFSESSNDAADLDPEVVRVADKPEEITKSVEHMRRHRKARRQAQRDKRAAETPGSRPFKKAALKHLQNASALQTDANAEVQFTPDITTAPPVSTPIQTDCSLDMADVPVTANAFTAKPYKQSSSDRRAVHVDELKNQVGWQYISWTGRCVVHFDRDVGTASHRGREFSTCHALLDQKGFVIGALCGQPKWGNINEPLMKIFDTTREAYSLSAADCESRRGKFPSIATGISFGGGQKVSVVAWTRGMWVSNATNQRVGNLAHTAHNQAVWNAVMKLVPIKRVANFANCRFSLLIVSHP